MRQLELLRLVTRSMLITPWCQNLLTLYLHLMLAHFSYFSTQVFYLYGQSFAPSMLHIFKVIFLFLGERWAPPREARALQARAVQHHVLLLGQGPCSQTLLQRVRLAAREAAHDRD